MLGQFGHEEIRRCVGGRLFRQLGAGGSGRGVGPDEVIRLMQRHDVGGVGAGRAVDAGQMIAVEDHADGPVHLVELGQELGVDTFEAGIKVDVTAKTKGKGTAGVMKRHGFAGVGASHGQHRNHRKPGSIGGAATPGRVFKGMRMAGRMGAVKHTTQNLTIHAVDNENNFLLIKGAVPGPKGGVVLVRSAVKEA